MANQNVFCNTPWYEAHIYWDGSLGICCQESRKLYSDSTYNIKNMSLSDWFNSAPVKDFRLQVLSDTPTDLCSRCYAEEHHGGTSRRHRSNQKSVIFTRTAFDDSYKQSPGYPHFSLSEATGATGTYPIDLHIDLGNYCNLACKMCHSQASSSIATQYVQWGFTEHKQFLGSDWTKDSVVWNRFLNELLTIPKLKNIHFMGGETLLTGRFEEFVDFMIANERFDLSFSFVSNGTVFKPKLLDKLKNFARVGIEISIESTTVHNDYVRQGTNTVEVLSNINKYREFCNGTSISLTLRPAISALTIGYYHTVIDYCLTNKFLIKSLLVITPDYLNVNILPDAIKQQYLTHYYNLLDAVAEVDASTDFNESDPNNYVASIKIQIQQAISVLTAPTPKNQDKLLANMVSMCKRWDKEYKFNAIELYPELKEIFEKYGY